MSNNTSLESRYHVNDGYIHRCIAGSDVIITLGNSISNLNGYIEFNSSAAFIWDCLKEPCSVTEIINKLTKEFGVEYAQALTDTTDFLQELLDKQMISEC